MLQKVSKVIELGELRLIEGLVLDALDAGDQPSAILLEDMIPAICIVGAKLRANEISVHQMNASEKTMKKGIEVLKPYLTSQSVVNQGQYLFGKFDGDLYDIDKNIDALMRQLAEPEVVEGDYSRKDAYISFCNNSNTYMTSA